MNGENAASLHTVRIAAKKLPVTGPGRAQFRAEDGTVGFVEEVTLHYFRKQGWDGVWGENELWSTLMALLFWDIIFVRVEGFETINVGHRTFTSRLTPPHTEPFPSIYRDMPLDLVRTGFYDRRAHLIGRRLEVLRDADLGVEVETSFREHYGEPCRPIFDWEAFSVAHLAQIVTEFPRDALLEILHDLLKDYVANGCGFPDLLIWRSGEVAFAEVKGPTDKLRKTQESRIEALNKLGLLCYLAWVGRSPVAEGQTMLPDIY
jgi:Fanconi-associated nuclease 1